ncbi:MAG: SpoIVB peptidase [Lachnospiraceae bacterium]|nr:SpoIVB peptidase [Lachnospiraceae bacterium]MDE7273053.1 SpoIVB peptidase [Lachnospiraceae bacterium]
MKTEKIKHTALSRRIKYLLFLYVLLGFAIGLFCWATYAYYQSTVPSTISIKAGTSEEFNLRIPASGVLSTDSDTVLALNQPLTIVAGDTTSSYQMRLKLFGIVPLKEVDIQVIENTTLTPVGRPIGIYVRTQGVLVVDTGSFEGAGGDKYAPSEYKLQAGDYLTAMDGVGISDKKQIREYVENGNGAEIIFQVSRKDELIQVKIKPELDANNVYKMGAWLRDSAQGIGTMTYIDSQNQFGALGHGINDMDTGELLKLGSGLLYHTEIVAVKRGERGNPGELTGVIEYKPDQVSGVIVDNTIQGIYGVANAELLSEYTVGQEALPIALKQEVTTGAAQILCTIDGDPKYYDVEITKLTPGKDAVNRQISLEVTDAELLSLTGGIVQGMSGAPIVQDGKFVGAVTHVLVQDSTKGYGIFIEDMLGH